MRKFLLTLLFTIFANPLFAEDIPTKTKPAKKLNIQISISNETSPSLEKITKNFNNFRDKNICVPSYETNSIQLMKEKRTELTICKEATAIKDIYNCVCKAGGEFYDKLLPITTFKKLSGTTAIEQFTQLQKYYNALNSIIGIQQLAEIIKDSIQQNKDIEAANAAERAAIIETFKSTLSPQLKKERDLRNENPEIVKNLTSPQCKNSPDCLEQHYSSNKANIEKWVAKNGDDNALNGILDEYIKEIIKDNHLDDNNALKAFLDNITDPKNETGITNRNIEKIKEAKTKKDAQDARDKEDALEELAKRKEEERNLINNIGAIQDPTISVNTPITKDNCNNSETNKDLNTALTNNNILGDKAKSHPEEPSDDITKIKNDIEDTDANITALKKRLKDIQKQKSDEIKGKFDEIKRLLHDLNIEECILYGRIDDIINQIEVYKRDNDGKEPFHYIAIAVSGKLINKSNTIAQPACVGLGFDTIDNIAKLTDLTKQKKWLDCLDEKITDINKNLTAIRNYKDKMNTKNCPLSCVYERDFRNKTTEEKYNLWYTGNVPNTKYTTPQNPIEEQLLQCLINQYQCKDGNEVLPINKSNVKDEAELDALCNEAKEKNKKKKYIDNYTCEDSDKKPLNRNIIEELKTALRTFNKDNVTLTALKEEGKRLCDEKNNELAKQKYIDTYTCNGIKDAVKNNIKNELQQMLNNNSAISLDTLKAKGTERCNEEKRKAEQQKAIDEFICKYEGTDFSEAIRAQMTLKLTNEPNITADKLKEFGNTECAKIQAEQENEKALSELIANFQKMCDIYMDMLIPDEYKETNHLDFHGESTFTKKYEEENYDTQYNNDVIRYAKNIDIANRHSPNFMLNRIVTEQCHGNSAAFTIQQIFNGYIKKVNPNINKGLGYKEKAREIGKD